MKVKSVKVYVEHCESKVCEGVCGTLCEGEVCMWNTAKVKVYVEHCVKVKCVDVYVEHCVKVKAYVEHCESEVCEGVCGTLYGSEVCMWNTVRK